MFFSSAIKSLLINETGNIFLVFTFVRNGEDGDKKRLGLRH